MGTSKRRRQLPELNKTLPGGMKELLRRALCPGIDVVSGQGRRIETERHTSRGGRRTRDSRIAYSWGVNPAKPSIQTSAPRNRSTWKIAAEARSSAVWAIVTLLHKGVVGFVDDSDIVKLVGDQTFVFEESQTAASPLGV